MMGVLWTLPVEMQMYLFLPVIFLLVQRVTNARILLGLWFISAIGGYGVTALLRRLTVNRVVMTFDWGWIAFPRLFEFVPYFLGGVLAYAIWRRGGRTVPFWVFACVLGALATAYLTLLEMGAPGRLFDCVQHGGDWARVGDSAAARSGARLAAIGGLVRHHCPLLVQHLPHPRSLHLVRLRCAGGAAWAGAMGGLSGFARDHLLVPRPVCGTTRDCLRAMARATTDDDREKRVPLSVGHPSSGHAQVCARRISWLVLNHRNELAARWLTPPRFQFVVRDLRERSRRPSLDAIDRLALRIARHQYFDARAAPVLRQRRGLVPRHGCERGEQGPSLSMSRSLTIDRSQPTRSQLQHGFYRRRSLGRVPRCLFDNPLVATISTAPIGGRASASPCNPHQGHQKDVCAVGALRAAAGEVILESRFCHAPGSLNLSKSLLCSSRVNKRKEGMACVRAGD